MSKSNNGVRCNSFYRRKVLAIMLSMILTVVTQYVLFVTIQIPDSPSQEVSDANIGVEKKKPLFHVIAAYAAEQKASELTVTTTSTTTTFMKTTTTTTQTTSTTMTTTSSATTTIATTVAKTLMQATQETVQFEEVAEDSNEQKTIMEGEPETETVIPEYGSNEPKTIVQGQPTLPISNSDYILLCNVVGHEYGSDYVPIEEKAKVVETVMNRVNSPSFPNTIYGVITQPYQFTGCWAYVNLGTYSKQVTSSVKEAVTYYFNHVSEYQHGYLFFSGDGRWNYFR